MGSTKLEAIISIRIPALKTKMKSLEVPLAALSALNSYKRPAIRIRVVGSQKLLTNVKKFESELTLIAKEELVIAADELYNRSMMLVPTDTPGYNLRATAYKDISLKNLEARVGYNTVLAAYHEFGTGAFVRVPQDMQEYAMRFYVNGKGVIPANAFLYPSLRSVEPEMQKSISDQIERLWK